MLGADRHVSAYLLLHDSPSLLVLLPPPRRCISTRHTFSTPTPPLYRPCHLERAATALPPLRAGGTPARTTRLAPTRAYS